ncbi:helix-turn-helix domain-containing protein [Moraxella bovis]|uniref:helix-turn-helix transcriptional regulator n=2 Tax=Moraxella bovis TaxID=476 RepID=UPI0022280457|nr:helix-turn-helix domain-containing protein [Moraxella bovis]UYZ67965.1 helix-turn-helix domain-containing protein [Moraxella bovis]UYZ70340.1 helix-turn-helix domain-containing protein [Moraxella bovis]UYZ73750.1 helix-turn-helix domain-containing protein [Moraxella bovis]UZA13639.1 helix-turn-helix domain-containing protein [Moraxella bovis]UZA28006.1 helix-turn-helix domain-containing protein [Moraxella bovis]
MIDFETICELREERQWTQEQMAEKLGLTRQGYAKIETGKSLPNLERLDEIAKLFGVNLFELLKTDNKSVVYQIGENYHGNNNYYNNNEKLQTEIDKLKLEIEKLNLIIAHRDELLKQKEDYIQVLKKLVSIGEELSEL